VSEIRIRRFSPGQSLKWVSCGWRLLRRRPLEAFLPAAVFALVALLVLKIPVLGNVLLLLLLPTLVASYFLQAHLIALTGSGPRPSGRGVPVYLRWGRELRQALFGSWTKTENIFPLILVGIVMVLLGLIAMFLFTAVGGQGVVSPYKFFDLTPLLMAQVLMAYGAVALLWALVAGMVLWSLPMLVLRDMELGDALRWGMRGFTRNIGSMLVFVLLLATVLLPGALTKPWWPIAHHVVQWLMLTITAVLFGFGAYCSYRLVFADVEERAERPAPARPPTGTKPASPPRAVPPAPRRS